MLLATSAKPPPTSSTSYASSNHIKLVVEQNPQMPERTAHLLRNDTDRTMALYATCKRLESAGAEAIAIPCNTAHAFVERIQAHCGLIASRLAPTERRGER